MLGVTVMSQVSSSFHLRFSAILLLVAVVDFAVTALVLQVTRTDLNPIAMPLSAYLKGDGSAWLRAAYYLMACALAVLAWASYQGQCAVLRRRPGAARGGGHRTLYARAEP
jgi:hypothetical protein